MYATTSLVQPTFLFDDRKRFDAECEHDRLRSSIQSDIDAPINTDPWKQRPVDFTMKNFHPNRQKRTNQSSTIDMSPKETQPPPQISRFLDPTVMQPFVLPYQNTMKKQDDDDENDFVSNPRIKYNKVKRMLNTEQYKNPKLHDYRQYQNIKELGLPDFDTIYEQDPYKIRFLSNHLNTLWLHEREDEHVPVVEKPVPEMYRALTARQKWDSRLVLPKLVFPNKYAAYTRYRNPTRTVQSAYWERVEDGLQPRQNTLEKKRLGVV